MADREQPYDPYVPSGQGASGQGNERTAQLQAVSCDTHPQADLYDSGAWHRMADAFARRLAILKSSLHTE